MKITAAVVRVRSAPFEIETLDLAAPLTDEVLVRVVTMRLRIGTCCMDAQEPRAVRSRLATGAKWIRILSSALDRRRFCGFVRVGTDLPAHRSSEQLPASAQHLIEKHIGRVNADADNPGQPPNHGVGPALGRLF